MFGFKKNGLALEKMTVEAIDKSHRYCKAVDDKVNILAKCVEELEKKVF